MNATLPCEAAETSGALEYQLGPNVALIVREDGRGQLLNMDDRFYALSPIATTMLRLTLSQGVAAAVDRIRIEFGAEESVVRADVDALIADLVAKGLVFRGDEVQSAPRAMRSARCAAKLLAVLFGSIPWLRSRPGILLTWARLSFKLAGWNATLAAWRRRFPVAVNSDPQQGPGLVESIDKAVCDAAARRLVGVDCKERALSCWALARSAGLPAALVIGVQLFPLAGHCWCEIGSRIVSDREENCLKHVPALRFE